MVEHPPTLPLRQVASGARPEASMQPFLTALLPGIFAAAGVLALGFAATWLLGWWLSRRESRADIRRRLFDGDDDVRGI